MKGVFKWTKEEIESKMETAEVFQSDYKVYVDVLQLKHYEELVKETGKLVKKTWWVAFGTWALVIATWVLVIVPKFCR